MSLRCFNLEEILSPGMEKLILVVEELHILHYRDTLYMLDDGINFVKEQAAIRFEDQTGLQVLHTDGFLYAFQIATGVVRDVLSGGKCSCKITIKFSFKELGPNGAKRAMYDAEAFTHHLRTGIYIIQYILDNLEPDQSRIIARQTFGIRTTRMKALSNRVKKFKCQWTKEQKEVAATTIPTPTLTVPPKKIFNVSNAKCLPELCLDQTWSIPFKLYECENSCLIEGINNLVGTHMFPNNEALKLQIRKAVRKGKEVVDEWCKDMITLEHLD